jgi:hypothetical protein
LNRLALLARREETLIALMQFLMLPLSFAASLFFAVRAFRNYRRST